MALLSVWLVTVTLGCAPKNPSHSDAKCTAVQLQLAPATEQAVLTLIHPHPGSGNKADRVYFGRDSTVCVSEDASFSFLRGVQFEPGSAEVLESELPSEEVCSKSEGESEDERVLDACTDVMLLEFEIARTRHNAPDKHEPLPVHGYAWPWETRCEAEAIALSQRRAEAVANWIESRQSFDKYEVSTRIIAHGTKRTDSPHRESTHVIGADVGFSPFESKAQHGPALDSATLERLRKVTADYVDPVEGSSHVYRLTSAVGPPPLEGCEVQPSNSGPNDFNFDCSEDGPRRRYYRRRTGEDALIDWMHRLVEEECDPTEVPPAGGLLDVALVRRE